MIENHFTHLKMSSEEEYESPIQDQRGKNASDEDESPEEEDNYD